MNHILMRFHGSQMLMHIVTAVEHFDGYILLENILVYFSLLAEEIPQFSAHLAHFIIAAQMKYLLLHCRNSFLIQNDLESHKDVSEKNAITI